MPRFSSSHTTSRIARRMPSSLAGNDSVRGRSVLKTARICLVGLAASLASCTHGPSYEGRSASDWMNQLHSSDSDGRQYAAIALGQILSANPGENHIIVNLVAALKDTNDPVRIASGRALVSGGTLRSEAISGVTEVAHDSAHSDVRASALSLLGRVGASDAPRVVDVLIEGLRDVSPDARAEAASAIERLGANAAGTLPALRRLATDSSARVRSAVVSAIAAIPSSDDSLDVAILRSLLADSSGDVRTQAAFAMAAKPRSAMAALPELTRALDDPLPEVRRGAASALGELAASKPEARRALERHANDSDVGVRREVAAALSRSASASRAVPR